MPSDDDGRDVESTAYLKNRREYMRCEVTRINSNIETELLSLSIDDKSNLVLRLEKVRKDLVKINQKIFAKLYQEGCTDENTNKE